MARTRRAALLITIIVTLVLTGCSADHSSTNADREAPPDPAPAKSQGQGTGPEVDAEDNPQSTFGVDVDTASYGYASRLINDGQLPERSAIRPEEFVNSFTQEYPQPKGDGFAVHVDGSRPPVTHERGTDGDLRLLRIGLQTRADDRESRPDASLTFVVDVSGSMGEPGRLDLVRDSLHTLVDELRGTDSVAIVSFNEDARVVRKVTQVSDAEALHDAIDSLRSGGSTNVEGGLVLGYKVARESFRAGPTNRVIVLSDGLANVGSTDAEPILRRVREEARKEIALLGVGVGSEYGDKLMEQLADQGDGFVVYVGTREQAREVLVRRLPATLTVRALDAKVQVTFEPGTVRSYRLIGYDNRAIANEDFRDDRVDGGEVGPGHSVTALYAVRLTAKPARTGRVAQVRVRWLDPTSRAAAETYGSVSVADLDGDFDRASPRLWVCYAAGYLAEALRRSEYGREVRLADLAQVADRAAEATEDPRVRDLAALIRRAHELD